MNETSKSLEPREPVVVLGDTLANGDVNVYTYEVPREVDIKELFIHAYDGQAFDLRYTVKIYRKQEDKTYNLINQLTSNDYIAGNADRHEFKIRRRLQANDEIRITVENVGTSGNNYTTNLRMDLDYETTPDIIPFID